MIKLLCFGGGERSVELPTPPSAKKKRSHVDPFTVQQLLASVGSARPLLLWAHAGGLAGDSGPLALLDEDTALVAGGTYYITYKTISVYVADAAERGTVISVELCSLFVGPEEFTSQPSQFVLALQHKLCDAVHARFSAWSHFQWWARLDPAEPGRVEITDPTAAAWSCFLSPLADGPAQPQLFVAPSTATNRYSESDAALLRDGDQLSPAWRVARASCFFTASRARSIKDKPAFAAKFCCFTADTQPSSAFAKANLDHGREMENFVRVAALAALTARRVSFDAYRAGMCFSIW